MFVIVFVFVFVFVFVCVLCLNSVCCVCVFVSVVFEYFLVCLRFFVFLWCSITTSIQHVWMGVLCRWGH